MKKTFTVIIAVILLSGISFAGIGITTGVNLANFNGVAGLDLSSRTGFSVGLFLDHAGSGFSVMPSILYTQKGASYSQQSYQSGYAVKIDVDLKYDYIECPIMGRYVIETASNIKPFLLAGPYLGILLSSKISGTGSVQGYSQTATVEANIPDQKTVDIGLAFGGGIKVELGSTALNINLKYSFGLMSVDNADTKNSSFSIMAGISF